ncbi:hypothetical protein LAZ67_2003362 [Cordylochernes scorpioides]|uniref:Uncharacterized protein n=1 Tax=Cordylochernes scorpioides TaxID=51811 RepID=A0ABY6K5N0_9ARAC|nr:hypothetical protein LAZ67_2003362 [Cordylochernes scorpioides]
MLGSGVVFQLMKMTGQVLVGLESTEKAERLSEKGLTIGNNLLKVFPYRKRAEKIMFGNLPIAIRDEDLVAALRPYCMVVSLTHEVVASGGYTWTTGNMEDLILLNKGLKIHQLPVKLVIVSKGESMPAYIIYGFRSNGKGAVHRLRSVLRRRSQVPLHRLREAPTPPWTDSQPDVAQEIKATRKKIVEARAQQATGTMDHCVYVEHCPEIGQFQYVLALNMLVGGINIIQLNMMNGHVLVVLATKALADSTIEEGLEFETPRLRPSPSANGPREFSSPTCPSS